MLQNEIWHNPKAPGIKLNPTRQKFDVPNGCHKDFKRMIWYERYENFI